jgi:hypothetical protein
MPERETQVSRTFSYINNRNSQVVEIFLGGEIMHQENN